METVNIVLKNSEGQVLRTLNWDSEIGHVVRILETGRIQIVASTNELKRQGIDFELIKGNIRKSAVQSYGISLGIYGKLEVEKEKNIFSDDVKITEDTTDTIFSRTLKKTTYAHVGAIALLFFLSWSASMILNSDKPEPVKVTQKDVSEIRKEHAVTVNVSKRKIPKKFRYAKVKTKYKVRKIKRNPRITKNRSKKRNNGKVSVNVKNVGALGLLGGKVTGSKESAGAWSSTKAKRGSGLSQNSLKGGSGSGLPGKGLISAPRGNSGKGIGSGGYATRGQGGGKQGYGKMNTGGSGQAYSEPLTEEALIEGGLDRDQIASVINRHIGQIIYCYEKGLQTKPTLSGRVNVRFTIGGTGSVKSANVANTSLRSKTVENCIVNKLVGWKFPKPYGNVNVNVTYPFVLKRVSQR